MNFEYSLRWLSKWDCLCMRQVFGIKNSHPYSKCSHRSCMKVLKDQHRLEYIFYLRKTWMSLLDLYYPSEAFLSFQWLFHLSSNISAVYGSKSKLMTAPSHSTKWSFYLIFLVFDSEVRDFEKYKILSGINRII